MFTVKQQTKEKVIYQTNYCNQPWEGQGKAANILWDTSLEKSHDTG